MAVCDREGAYTGQLAEYLGACKRLPFEVQAFTEQEALAEYAKCHSIDLLLASMDFLPGVSGQENVRQIMMLTEEDDYKGAEACAYKYQSADKLVCEILRLCTEKQPVSEEVWRRNTDFYAVYSPVKRCGKTGFAVMLGQVLAERGRVLYLNFEEYPGFGHLFEKEDCDLSEVLLCLRQGRESVYHKIQKNVRTLGRIDYVPPGIGHADISRMKWEHWECLLESIRVEEVYDAVILDLGNVQDTMFGIFGYCREIFMPVLDDPVSRAKLAEFQWVCAGMEVPEVIERIRVIRPPAENYWEMLDEHSVADSKLYRYAMDLLED